MNRSQLKIFLDKKAELYENLDFIQDDPIQIPHLFSKKEDIEIAGFLTSIIAWGQRKTIINNGKKLMHLMDDSPHDFILNHEESDLEDLKGFVHRTFNSIDLIYFIRRLQSLYQNEEGLESSFSNILLKNNDQMLPTISQFKALFFKNEHEKRSEKHLPDPERGSAAKRFNMYLRWMVRSDKKEVDFGIWKSINTSQLYLPLDVHTGNVARELGILERKQNDVKALEEVMKLLRQFDTEDPVKYDFALFGMGVYES